MFYQEIIIYTNKFKNWFRASAHALSITHFFQNFAIKLASRKLVANLDLDLDLNLAILQL
jgi:hypothetical protein